MTPPNGRQQRQGARPKHGNGALLARPQQGVRRFRIGGKTHRYSAVVDGQAPGAVQTVNYSGIPATGRPEHLRRMQHDFRQFEWDDATAEDCRELVRLAVREDLEREQDWTTVALVPAGRIGAADIVARQAGVAAGMHALTVVFDEMAAQLSLDVAAKDGQAVEAGAKLARIEGQVRDLLTCERILLNFLGRLMGIATLAAQYVDQVEGTGARIYDTRKTTPGWRRLEKYAVRCGGASNHRTGLYDAILIKDNHLAQFAATGQSPGEVVASAVRQARQFASELAAAELAPSLILEVEVDSIEQLAAVLLERPDIVLLDNMTLEKLREAVAMRDQLAPEVELEASGGVTLDTVRRIAETGVNRISVGGLTHAARSLDIALDWHAN
jgi:nicotinate-nucleotide pyrophosphorylase (carboxylating)